MFLRKIAIFVSLALLLGGQHKETKAYKNEGGGIAFFRVKGETFEEKTTVSIAMVDSAGNIIGRTENQGFVRTKPQRGKEERGTFIDLSIRGAPGDYVFMGIHSTDIVGRKTSSLLCDTFGFKIEDKKITNVGDLEVKPARRGRVTFGYHYVDYLGLSEEVDESYIHNIVDAEEYSIVDADVVERKFYPLKANFRTARCNNETGRPIDAETDT